MTRDAKVQLVAAVVLAGALAVSGTLAVAVSASAGRHKLTYTDRAERGQQWEESLGIAMGVFRGLFVNFLWVRANQMKEDGKFHEAVQLASAITRLQPRFPRVWVFHAWNLAYNISVGTQTREERWEWVQAGIRLLRDHGIPANPHDMLLPRELAWIYLHKIAGYTDDANMYYKRKVAEEWTNVLGVPPRAPPLERSTAVVTALFADWLRVVAEAPETLDEAIAREPVVRTLVDRLKAETGDDPGLPMLRRRELYLSLQKSPRRGEIEKIMGPRNRAYQRLVEDPALAPAWPVLVAHVRKRVLVDVYHMDPRRMLRYTETYGPIDWRCPAAHALYWGAQGVENGLTRWTERNRRDMDPINTDRIVNQALQELYRAGDLYFAYLDTAMGQNGFYMGLPNVHFVDSYEQRLLESRERSWADAGRAYSFYFAGYENFLKDAIRFFFRRGQYDVAERYRRKLITDPRQNLNDPERNMLLAIPLNDFIRKELEDRMGTPYVMASEVTGALQGAYAGGLLGNDEELFRTQFAYAAYAHRYYMEIQFRRTAADQSSARMEQLDRDFRVIAGEVFAGFALALDIEQAQILYNAAPVDLRRFAYDQLVTAYTPPPDAPADLTDLSKLFVEPPGMPEHRAMMQRVRDQRSSPGAVLENK